MSPDTGREALAADAWRTADRDGEHAVVVRMGRVDDPHWYVLCPAAATLYLTAEDAKTYGEDCSLGAECDWTEQHIDAAALIQRLAAAEWRSPEPDTGREALAALRDKVKAAPVAYYTATNYPVREVEADVLADLDAALSRSPERATADNDSKGEQR